MADYSQPSSNNFGPLFYGADQKYGLRPGTTGALSYVESRYNPRAVSPQGAEGLTQLMPSTAQSLGVSNPFDPAQSVDGGARYFKQGLDAEGGDYAKAAMYYHGGPNTNIWGPKTHAYADNFMGRLQSVQASAQSPNPYQQQPQPGGQPQMPPQQPPASLGQMAAPNIGADPNAASLQYQGPSLASLATMPNVKQPSKFTAGNILGTLGDALSAYGGKAPTFGPFLREQQMMQQQQNFEMQKYQQQIAMQMYLMRNGLDTETGKKLVAAGVQPGTPEWTSAMATSATNDLNPVVNTEKGPVLRSSVVPHYDPQAVAMLRDAMAKGDHAAAQEFDEHFGRGASLQALGQQ